MLAFRSSPCRFPATNCILIVLIAPCRRCDDINYSTTWKLFSFLFSPSFPLFSQPLAKDTLPHGRLEICSPFPDFLCHSPEESERKGKSGWCKRQVFRTDVLSSQHRVKVISEKSVV